MNRKEKLIVGRMLYAMLIGGVLWTLVNVEEILNTDASYAVPLETAATAVPDTEELPLTTTEMPADAYRPVRLTFAGSCTTGSMLGSASYGTFNELLDSDGAEYFLRKLDFLFHTDDLTVAGCNVTLSDRDDLPPAERDTLSWFRGPAGAARIFSEGGIDALSLHAPHPWDYGADGYSDTKTALEASALRWGDHGKAIYTTIEGADIAVYCRYVDDPSDAENVLAWLETAGSYDFTALYILTPETASDLPDDDRRTMLRSFADAGADLVFATDAQRIQPAEQWGDSMILYSAGSLLDGRTKYPSPYTVLCGVELQVLDSEILNIEYTLTPCRTYDDDHPWRPHTLSDPAEYDVVTAFLAGNRETPFLD